MTKLTKGMYEIFLRDEFSFKKLKQEYSPAEVDQIKADFKAVWQVWKQINQNVAAQLPQGQFAKVHVESWTNGWNLRDHFWASYRLTQFAQQSPCIGVMLDKKQLQVYLMFQHYNSQKRGDTPRAYNKLLADIPSWSKNLSVDNWFLWDKDEMEFADHLSLEEYLTNEAKRDAFNTEAKKSSFLIGKFVFYPTELVNCEDFISQTIAQIVPLYQKMPV